MTYVIIDPLAYDVLGIKYSKLNFLNPLLVLKETDKTVTVKLHDYAVTFDRSYILKAI